MYNSEEVEMIEDTIPAIKQESEIQYHKCKKLIFKHTHRLKRMFREIEQEEIVQKANEIYTECYHKYQSSHSSKAKFSTYLCSVLSRKLYKWCMHKREKEYIYSISLNEEVIKSEDTNYIDSFGYFKTELSDTSKMIVETVMQYQNEIMNSNSKYKTHLNKNNVMRFLVHEKNMKKREVLNSYAEITSMLRG